MDTVTLKYGDSTITLHKSPDLIGLVPKGVLAPSVRRALVPETAESSDHPERRLGGFEVHRVDPGQMEERLNELRQSPAVRVGTHVWHSTPHDSAPIVPTGEIYVEWAPGTPTDIRNGIISKLGLSVVKTEGPDQTVFRTTMASPNPIKVAEILQQQSAMIRVAEPDLAVSGKLHALVLPSDEDLERQWHLRNTGLIDGNSDGLRAGADARVLDAWERFESMGSNGVVVGVIDDGFDLTHPDLSGPGKVVAPWDFTRGSDDPSPDHYGVSRGELQGDWHGTACAGVAVGNANGSSIVGAAPACRLMPVRWSESISDLDVEQWFDYVRNQGAWVVSCSWGVNVPIYRLSTRQSRAISRCAREGRGGLGTVIVFAAGNENSDVNDPSTSIAGFAIHPDVICVAASTSRDERAHYSNYGDEIWICAPSSGAGGRGVVTADVLGSVLVGGRRYELGYSRGGVTGTFGGTSSATPLVAGICGLILSLRPELTATDVKDLLRRTARRIGDPGGYDDSGHSQDFGYGCVDAVAALEELLSVNRARIVPFWGSKGHHSTNRIAISALPDSLLSFYFANQDYIEREAMAADDAKQRDRDEKPRHYIDLDEYGPYPFRGLPEAYADAVARYGEATVIGRGLVPWIVEERYNDLVSAFKAGKVADILRHSAWLGHYIGDSHVPLHTTANHDGQLTRQKGLHSHFESTVLDFVDIDTVVPAKAAVFNRPILELAFEWVRESHLHIPTILQADLQARRGSNRQRDKKRFAELVGNIALERLTYGSHRLACAWLSAWHAAGEPDLAKLAKAETRGAHPTSGSAKIKKRRS